MGMSKCYLRDLLNHRGHRGHRELRELTAEDAAERGGKQRSDQSRGKRTSAFFLVLCDLCILCGECSCRPAVLRVLCGSKIHTNPSVSRNACPPRDSRRIP